MSDLLSVALHVVGLACLGGVLFASGIGWVPYLVAVSTLRIDATAERASVRLLDGAAATIVLGVASVLVPPLIVVGWPLAGIALVLSALLLATCRVAIEATAAGSRVTRRVLGVPWRRVVSSDPAEVWIDGWGDVADPLALHARVGELALELAWFGRGADADGTLARLEAALGQLEPKR